MPKIPKFRSKTPQVGVGPTASISANTKTAEAVTNLGQGIMDFGLRLEQKRQSSIVNTYVSTSYSEDLIDSNSNIERIKLDLPEDGTGYVDEVIQYYDQKMAQRRNDAPNEAAFNAYAQKLNLLKAKSVIEAQNFETSRRSEWSKTKQNMLVDKYASQQLFRPDPDQALMYSGDMEALILAQVGEIYTQEEADERIQSSHRKIFSNLINGLIKGDNPERALAILKATVNTEEYEGALDKNALNDPGIYSEDAEFSRVLGKSLTLADKNKFLSQSIDAIKSKNKNVALADAADLKNLGMAYRLSGDNPILDSERDRIFNRVQRDPNKTVKEKAKIIDRINMDIALGNTVKRVSKVPIDERKKEYKKIIKEEIESSRSKLSESLTRMQQLGLSGDDIEEAKNSISSPIFNLDKISSIEKQGTESIQKDMESFFSESATYVNNAFEKMRVLSNKATNDELAMPERTLSFQSYSTAAENYYDYMKLPVMSRKLLTPEMSLYYAGKINDPSLNAADGIRAIHRIASEHGIYANKTFNEMAKRKHISPGVFALAQMDPKSINQAQVLYGIMKDKKSYENIKNRFDGRKSDQIELEDEIKNVLAPLTAAIKRSDPSGASMYGIQGLEQLISIGVMSDIVENNVPNVRRGVDKWSEILIKPYRIAEANNSIAFVKSDTDRYYNDLDTFLRRANGPVNLKHAPNSLEKQLIKLGLASGIVPDKRWIDQASDLGDMDYANQKLDERLSSVEFVMNSSYDGLIMMHTDTGVRKEFKDSEGKTIEIPYNRLGEFDFTPNIGEIKETEEKQIRSIMESKFGTGGLF